MIEVQAYDGLPPKVRTRTWHLNARTEYFTTEDNFTTEGGEFDSLGADRSYENLSLQALGNFAFSRRFTAMGGFRVAYASSTNIDFNRTNSQLSDLYLGAQLRALFRPVLVMPQILVTVPVEKIDQNTDEVMTSEGALDVGVGSWFEYSTRYVSPYVWVAGHYRSEGRASLLRYRVGAALIFKNLRPDAAIYGTETLTDDEYVDRPEVRSVVNDRVAGRSLRYYAINPSVLGAEAGFKYLFNRDTYLRAFYQQDLNGQNSAAGRTFGFSVNWAFFPDTVGADLPEAPRPSDVKVLKKFKSEREDYDESLFEEKDAPKPPPAATDKLNEEEDQLLKDAEKLFE